MVIHQESMGVLGDAINWESVLKHIPKGEELYFITDDRDYYSVLDINKPKEFLISEWINKLDSETYFFRRISQFFKEHYPDIKLASELEKELLVKELVTSANFGTTHKAISKLNNLEDFSQSQVDELVNAALNNTQVNWILGDGYVFNFFSKLMTDYIFIIDNEAFKKLNEELKACIPDEPNEDDVPF